MGSCAIHLQSYDWGPGRPRRSVCETGHAIRPGKGRTRPGYAWASSELDKSFGKGHRKLQTVPPLVSFLGRMACLRSHTQFQERTDGGTLGPTEGYRSQFQSHILKLHGHSRAVGHFRCSEAWSVQTLPRTFPSTMAIAIRGGPQQEERVSSRRAALDAGLVTRRPLASVSEPGVNHHGPRCDHRRDYTLRSLLDVAGDGAICGIISIIRNFRRFSYCVGPAEQISGGSVGECGGSKLYIFLYLNIGGMLSTFVLVVFR